VHTLFSIIASLQSEDGAISVDGFYEDVVFTDEMREQLASSPRVCQRKNYRNGRKCGTIIDNIDYKTKTLRAGKLSTSTQGFVFLWVIDAAGNNPNY
jgi:hypothetical protein